MAKFQSFEEIYVWQEATELAKEIYMLVGSTPGIKKDFGLKDQIQRSAVSISSNIAEGFERQSNQEFIRFLFIAKGSCGELRTQLHILFLIGLLEENRSKTLNDKCMKISGMLMNLIKTLRKV